MIKYSMKRILIIAVLFTFLPIRTNPKHHGLYNTFSGLIWCERYTDCVHEVGHKVDDEGGWISGTDEYRNTTEEMGLDLWNEKETYAEIFELAQGKRELMPEQLQGFYDWELADKLLKEYE